MAIPHFYRPPPHTEQPDPLPDQNQTDRPTVDPQWGPCRHGPTSSLSLHGREHICARCLSDGQWYCRPTVYAYRILMIHLCQRLIPTVSAFLYHRYIRKERKAG